ncbi:hypothetical protein Hte_001049 [Hypoxylon texense]
MESTASEATPEPQVVFRGKKRKTYRQRTEPIAEDVGSKATAVESPSQDASTPAAPRNADNASPAPIPSEDAAEEETGLSVAEVLRLRNARKSRLGGVKFGAGNTATGDAAADGGESLDELTLMIREEESKALDVAAGVKRRFAPQTGLAAEIVNKHMEEYIEAQLARRHNAIASSSSTSAAAQGDRSSSQESRGVEFTTTTLPKPEHRNRALQGQLTEVDLGDEARSRNEALTERARRRLQGEAVEDEEQAGRPRKVRLGKDGKPWRSRNRRNSDDIRRDQLVEEILRENRSLAVDVYETPTPPPGASTSAAGAAAAGEGADEQGGAAADDRIAEEFRREFLDAMAERHQKRKKPATNAPPGGAKGAKGAAKDDEVLKGPKLGGSRNVRAAIRNILLEKAKEAKKPR